MIPSALAGPARPPQGSPSGSQPGAAAPALLPLTCTPRCASRDSSSGSRARTKELARDVEPPPGCAKTTSAVTLARWLLRSTVRFTSSLTSGGASEVALPGVGAKAPSHRSSSKPTGASMTAS